MGLKNEFIEKKNNFYDFLTNPKTVKWSIILILIIFIPSIIIGVFVSQLHGPYNIIDNYISDLGSYNYTPIPKFLDDAAMITGFLLIPVTLYLHKLITQRSEEKIEKGRIILGSITVFLMFIGIIGIISLGFVDEDVGFYLKEADVSPWDLHTVFTVYLFPFIGFAGMFVGLICLIYSKQVLDIFELKTSKALPITLGIEMVILPQICSSIFLINLISPTVIIPPSAPFFEWMYLISLLTWLVILASLTLRLINRKINANN